MKTYLVCITATGGQCLYMTVLATCIDDAFTQVLRELEAPPPENPLACRGCARLTGEAA